MKRKLTHLLSAALTLAMMAAAGLAADPGIDLPNDPGVREFSQINDQKKGSVLIYNLYSSSASNSNAENTRISITNTNPIDDVAVHLFFVDGISCNVADVFICLTEGQTTSFLTADLDPGTMGYLIAIAVDADEGGPIAFDWLIGDEYVKLASGHRANLGAEAVSVAFPPLLTFPTSNGSQVALLFEGVCYGQLPRVLAVDNIPDRASGNDTLVVINRIGGNLATGAGLIGNVFGILYDDMEMGLSFSFTASNCQFKSSLSNNFPRTAPRFEQAIPAGRSGWMKFWSTSAVDQRPFGSDSDSRAITGAVLNANSNAGASANAFNGGRNLHKLTLNPFTVLVVPVFAPNC